MAEARIVINGREYPVPTSYTLGEQAEMERITGQGYDMGKSGALGILAIAYIAARRIDPTVTLADIETLGDGDFAVVGGEPTDAVPPQSPADEGGNEPPSSATSPEGSDGSPEPTPEATGTPL